MQFLFWDVAQTPIHITIQQPPGMPEWIKILITAGTGAMLGIISNIAMEYVKPWISRKQVRKTVEAQLKSELIENWIVIKESIRILEDAESKTKDHVLAALAVLKTMMPDIDDDRYTFNFQANKGLVYEIDPDKSLPRIYSQAKYAFSTASVESTLPVLVAQLKMVNGIASMYAEQYGLTIHWIPNDTYWLRYETVVNVLEKNSRNFPPEQADK